MELELGLKITKTRDDIASISEYQLAKDKGPVFQSRETNTTFILTAHLKGYKRNNIDIKISKDGSKITISGEKPIQEMVMIGWVMHKKVVDVTGFNKVFKIPNGVNLDRIKAKYDEDEWILSIVMPKLVKGICGLGVEEVKEEFDKRISELEKSETDHVSSSFGEISQRGSKEEEFDKRISELDKSETDHVSSSFGETSQRGSKDNVQDMECSGKNKQKMADDAYKEINGGRIKKEVGESNFGIGDGNGEGMREKVGKEECEVMKTSELEKNDNDDTTSQDKESEVKKMESRSVEEKKGAVSDKIHDDANDDIRGGTAEKEKEESKLRIEDDKLEGSIVELQATQTTGVTSQGFSEECLTQQSGDSTQKAFGESKCESEDRLKENMKEGSMEQFEANKVSELDQNMVDYIPSNIGDQRELEMSGIQQMEKTKSTKEKTDGGKYEKPPVDANKDVEKTTYGDIIKKNIVKPKIETDNEDEEGVREKPGKEGSDAMVGIREQFPKATLEESEELNVQKMQEIKDGKEEMNKKEEEIEYFVEKGEGERQKTMHVDENKDTRETVEEEIEKRKNEIEEFGQHVEENTDKGRFEAPKSITENLPKKLVELVGSKGFKVAEEEQKEMIKEEKVETERLMEKEEGEDSNKRKEESDKVLDYANKQMNDERIKKGVGESKIGIGDGNGKGVRKKTGKEEREVMKILELEKNVGVCMPHRIEDTTSKDKESEVQKIDSKSVEKKERRVSDKMLDDGNRDQTGSTIRKEREESKLRIDEGKVKRMNENIGKAACEAMKTPEIEQDIGAGFPQNIGDIVQDKELEEKGSVVEKKKIKSNNILHDTTEDITEEIEKYKFGIQEGGEKRVKEKVEKEGYEAMKSSEQEQRLGACTTQITGVTSQGVSEECLNQQSGESKQKEFGESKYETEDRLKENTENSSMETFEEIKVSKFDDQNEVDHIPNIGDISQKELEESRIQQMKKFKKTEGKIDDEQYGKTPVEGNTDVEKTIFGGTIIKPKIETENEDQECVGEDSGMEGSDAMAAIKDEFPKHLPKTTLEESEELNVQNMKETKDNKQEKIKRKGKEKGEGERHKTMHVDANRGIRRDTIEEEIEKRMNGIEESGQQHEGDNTVLGKLELPKSITEELPKKLVELDGSEEKVETESLMENEEGEESNKRNEEADKMLDDANKEMNDKRIKKVGESKMGIGDGNRDGVRKKVGKEKHEIEKNVGVCIPQRIEDTTRQDKETEIQKMKSRSVGKKEGKVSDKMLHGSNGEQTGSTIKKAREESKLRIEDGNVKGRKEKVGKETYEVTKTSEKEQDVGAGFPQNIGDISQIKEAEDQELEEQGSVVDKEKMEFENMLHDPNEEITKIIEKSKFGIAEGGGKSVKEKVEKEGYEKMKSSEHEEGVLEVPKSITEELPKKLEELDGSKELKAAKEEKQKEVTKAAIAETEILMEKMQDSKKENEKASRDTEKSTVTEKSRNTEKIHVEPNEDLKKDKTKKTKGEEIKDPKIRTKEKGEHYSHEEMSKERSQESKAAKELNIRDKFPKHLPKTTLEESEELKVQKMQEITDVKEEMIKRKGKDIEYLVEKGEGERHKRMHVDANKGITRETNDDETEKRKNGIEKSGQLDVEKNTVKGRFELPKSITEELPKKLVELDGSKGFKVAEEEEQQEIIKAEKDKPECLMGKEGGEESKKIGESKMGIGDGNGKGVTKKFGKREHEVMMETLELEKTVGECIPQRIEGTTSKDKKSEVQKMDRKSVEKKEGKEEFSKHLPKATLEQSEEMNVQKMQEIKDVKEEMIKRKGKENEYSEEKDEGERHKTMHVEENKGITRETMQDKIEKKNNGVDESCQQYVGENIIKGVSEIPKSITEALPKQLEKLNGSKELKVANEEEQKEVTKEAMNETKILMEKVEEVASKNRNEETSRATEKSTAIETLLKKNEESNFKKKSSDGPLVKEKLPKQVEEEISEVEKDKTEHGIVKLKGKGSKKMHVELNEAFENDTTVNRIEKEIRKRNLESSDQLSVKENVDSGIFYGRKRQKFPKIEEAEDAKEDGGKIEQSVRKVNADKYEKIQVEANEDFKKEITKDTKGKETGDPKIHTKEKSEHHLHEEMSKERSQESKAAKEDFPIKMLDSAADTREGLRDTKMEKTEGIKEENSENEQFVKKVKGEEYEKVQVGANGGLRNDTTKDIVQKEREEPKILSKETHGLKNEGMNQKNLKPEKIKVGEQSTYNTASPKEVATIEDQVIKPLSPPRILSTQQSAVEEKNKFYEGGKAKYEASRESQKEDPTKDMKNSIEMKENQEAKQKEPEIPLEKHIKKGGPVVRRGEFHKGKNGEETVQDKTEGPKKKIDERNQQYAAIDVEKVETTEEDMSKEYKADEGSIAERMETKKGFKTTLEREDYMPTQKVDDEKPRIQDEIIKADIGKVNKEKCILESMKTTQEKEHPIKSEAVEKETKSLEAISSLPNVTSMGVKEASPNNDNEDLHQKELPPLKAEMKSKEPLELEKPVIQWKAPKTKEHVPLTELRGKEEHDYVSKEIEEPKIAVYEGATPPKFLGTTISQQSTDEENRKSENVVEEHEATKESPKINIVETEKIDSFQPQVPENQYSEEQKVDKEDESRDRCKFQGHKIVDENRGQQHFQDNNDNKGSQTPKPVEEIFRKKSEGSKVAKSGEAKDSSRNKRERGNITQTVEEKKPEVKEKTPHFEMASGSKQVVDKVHETGDREHQIESEEVTSNSNMGVEPPTRIEKILKKEVERKEPHELTWPTMYYEFPKVKEVQQEANISKEVLTQATETFSKAKSSVEPKGKIDKPLENQFPYAYIEMLNKEPHESEECNMKEGDSKEGGILQVSEKKEPIHSTEGTTATEEGSVKEESQEAKKKDCKIDVEEPNKSKRDKQCINNEEEKDKAREEGLEEQNEYKEEASEGKKDGASIPKKLFVPLVIAGTALLGGIFVWHRRTRKR